MLEAALNFIPISVFFELTYQCNLKCIHCYVSSGYKNRELSLKEVKSALDQLKNLGSLFLYFSGGEPLLREDFSEIFKYARLKGFVVTIYTNATLINEGLINIFKEFGVYEIHVSLYSMVPKIHDTITGIRGSFFKTMKSIELMISKKIKVVIKCPLTKINFDGYEKLAEWADKNGLEYVFTPYITARNDGSKDPFELRLSDKLLEKALSDSRIDPFRQAQENKESDEFFVHLLDKTRNIVCFAGHNSLAINALGDVYPCIQFLYKLGNIKKQTLKEIWENSTPIKKIRSLRADQLKECNDCRFRRYCARCPGLALIEDGNLYGKSSFECKLAFIRSKLNASQKSLT